jgi:Zn-dependent M28 family amino/carboxypeptidase
LNQISIQSTTSTQCVEIPIFNGNFAYKNIEKQLSFGPRTPNSEGHQLAQQFILKELDKFNWETELQEGQQNNFNVKNIIGKRGHGDPWIILGAHYDTRIYADEDPKPNKRTMPVPGANDGGSGVAVLLEIARILPVDYKHEIWLVFFDSEDNGGIENRDWIMGSNFFVNKLETLPEMMVLLDMVADKDLNIYIEKNSDQQLATEIWNIAREIGYNDYFINKQRYRLIDDHLPFIQAGIPSVDIIDYDYPHWHTTEDTIDKISINSLQIVGNVLVAWLISVTP